MSQTSTINPDKLKVILSICQYLSKEIDTCDSPDVQESLTVAVQCVEAAYGINYEELKKTTHIPNLWRCLVFMGKNALLQAEMYKQKGNHFMATDRFQEAVDNYSCAIDINPQNAVYYCNRAAAFCRLENYDESVNDCKTAVQLDSNYSKAYGRLGLAYLSQNLHSQAVEAYSTAVRLDPTNEMYKQNLDIAMERLQSNKPASEESNPNTASRGPIGDPLTAPNVQTTFSQIVNNPNLLNMASEMLSDQWVRNAMTGILQMGTQNAGNPSMENLLIMGQHLAQQMQQQHPDLIENLRQQFSDNSSNAGGDSPAPDESSEDKNKPDPKNSNDKQANI